MTPFLLKVLELGVMPCGMIRRSPCRMGMIGINVPGAAELDVSHAQRRPLTIILTWL
jgi:hypothetical protein